MNKLIIFDGHAVLHRAYHAMPDLTNYKGEHIGALHGMVSMLLKIIQDLKPTHIIFCFDEKGENFRHKMLPSYQENRSTPEDALQSQLDRAPELCSAIGIPTYSHTGYEADDLIGTIAEYAVSSMGNGKLEDSHNASSIPHIPVEVIVVTGDRDLLQLVDDKRKIRLYMPVKFGLSDTKLFYEKDVIERMGVTPSQIPDLKALIGDNSDNYFGIPGVGPKTAIKLLDAYKTFENVYKNLDKVGASTKKKLEEGQGSGELSLKLATIVRDVKGEYDIKKASKWDIDSVRAIKKFEEIGFRTLIERVKKVGKELDQEKQESLW